MIVRGVNLLVFEKGCEGYLKRAADANTVEQAKKELTIAITYMERHNLTEGCTSILWQTPDEDVAFWYNNIKSSREELSKVTGQTTPLEKTNILMKLRETLLDESKDGSSVTVPSGISIYPHNLLYVIWFMIGVFCIVVIVCINRDYIL